MVHGRQGAVCGQSTGSVCARQARAVPCTSTRVPPAHRARADVTVDHRPHLPGTRRRVESLEPCLHSCRCERIDMGEGHSPTAEGSQSQRKVLPRLGPQRPQLGGDGGSWPEQKQLHSPTEQSSSDLAKPTYKVPPSREKDKAHTTLPQKRQKMQREAFQPVKVLPPRSMKPKAKVQHPERHPCHQKPLQKSI